MIRLMFYGLLGWAAWRIAEENREKPIRLLPPRTKGKAPKS